MADERSIGTRDLFSLLVGTGLATDPMPLPDWRAVVGQGGARVLSAVALDRAFGALLPELAKEGK